MKTRFLTLLLLLSVCACSTDRYVSLDGFAQGGTWSVKCSLSSKINRQEVKDSIDSALLVIDNSISGYNKGSILSRVNAGERVALDRTFIEIFKISKEIWEKSGGAFDPSAGPLFDLWGFGFADSTATAEQKAAMAEGMKKYIGMDLFGFEETPQGTFLTRADDRCRLNFNAIAQGYSCDVVAHILDSYGCRNYIIELGGEIVCKGQREQGGPWRIWIDKPEDGNNVSGALKQDVVSISDCGLVTSGNYRKFYVEDGRKYSHTVDPVSGMPVKHSLLSATVIARDGATADAYATWFMVIGTEEAKQVISSRLAGEGIEAYLVYGDQDDMKVWHTPGLLLDSERSK
ncbi:MAG: FAD:protein FMN transferase [Bacteroidales bacterium]|nr:FAD:protein FMN transferase [Bacteroidales bacterium]